MLATWCMPQAVLLLGWDWVEAAGQVQGKQPGKADSVSGPE
jgi:hypothetical protein